MPLTSTTMCPPVPVPGGGPGDGSGSPAPTGAGGDVRACAASSTGSGARTECGRADQRCTAAKTPAATSTTANAARVFGSRPHLSCSHTGSRSRNAGTTLSRQRPAPPETGTVTEAEDEPRAEMEAPAAPPTGLGLGSVTGDEAGAEIGVGTTPSAGRATRPPYAPVISASARRRDAAATVSAPWRDVRRRPGPRPGPKPGPAPTPGPVPGPLRTRPSEAGARPGPLPLPLVARCDRGAMPHDGRHIRPKPLSRSNSGGQPTSCG
ncbi:hypothetical protein EES42_09815 [Streptomyces sp. ADI95-17]|nr:hypothetical protein EES42_09815 [Streptomyces sp. ADI95-17]